MRMLARSVALTTTLLLGGCISSVNVHKIEAGDTTTRGLRYSLPATFLLVQPQVDGTATYNWVYLPDPDKTYVINKRSFLAKFTLDVATSNGLLTSVEAQGDTTGVAAKLFDAAQSTYAAKAGADSKVKTADSTALASAKAAVVAAQLAVDQAKSEWDIDKAKASLDDQRAAEIKYQNAVLALNAAKAAKAALTANGAGFDLVGGGDVPAASGLAPQYGPVLFRVVQTDGQLTLLAMNNQDQFDTVNAQSSTPAPVPAPQKYVPTLAPGQKLLVGKNLTLKISFSDPIVDLVLSKSHINKDYLPVSPRMTRIVSPDMKSVTITFPDGLQAGTYSLTPALIETAGGQPTSASAPVDFTVSAH